MLNTNNNGSQNENNKQQQQQQKTRNNKHKSMLHNMFFMNLNLINDQKEIIINRISCNIPIYEYLHGISNIRLIRTNIKTTTKTTTTCRTSTWLRFFYTCLILSSLCQHTKCLHNSFKLSTNLVRTKYGLIRGIVVRNTPLVEAYLGIPYASPPMGSLRYMPPITPSTWKNVRTADRFSPVCPQTVPIPPNGPEALLEVPRARLAQLRRLLPLLKNQSEDCLYLNIYAPVDNRHNNGSKESSSSKLSTILYIHGESYEWGSGNPFDGTELATHGNVIVVTINFRLGIFGFLKTGGKESAQGNFGLMDLVAGMHWLKENLVAFGGNPQNITLLGHGSGAALANILAVSPVASDLLQRVVLVSGSALSPWALQKNPLFVKRRVAEQTGCHGDMLYDDLAPCLRTKSITDLLAVKIDHPRFLTGFAPFPDGTVIAANTESHDWPLPPGSTIVSATGIEFANFHKRDLIFCLNSVESYLDLSAQDLEFGFNETRRDRILRTFVRNNFHFHLNEIFAVLKNEYTDWERVIRNPMSARDATLAFLSDGHTAAPLIKVGYMHSLRGGRGYFIHFKHKTAEQEYPQRTGSVGGEDIPFWLGLPSSQLFPYNYTTQEKQISRYMLHYLANFVKTGNPNNAAEFPSKSNRGIFGHVYRKSSESEKRQVKRSSYKLSPLEQLSKNRTISEQRKALNLAIIYNQRIRNKRDFYKQHLSKEDDDSNYFIENNNKNNYIEETEEPELGPVLMGREHFILPYWDAYDVVNQLYLEMGSKPKIQSHYRGHKLSMWLNLIPQLHKHTNLNEQSMRHHFFPEHMDNLYEGAVRPQLPIRKMEVDEVVDLEQTTIKPIVIAKNPLVASNLTGTECAIDETNYSTEATTLVPKSNASSTSQKDLVTASTGIMGNLEVLRRLSSKQFQSYTTALVATVAVGFFLLVLNVLIFAGIYHQREKRARDARTKEELEDKDNSKNSSILKLNTVGLSHAESYKGSVIFSDFNCYDERGIEHAKESLPLQTSAWSFSSSKPHPSISAGSYEFPVTLKKTDIHANLEHSSYNLCTGLVEGKQEYELANSCTLSEFDYAVQSSDRMSFKEIEAAVKVSNDNHDIDLEIPDPPPPPRSFNNMQQAGILRQTGTASGSGILAGASGTGKKRVHIQEISV